MGDVVDGGSPMLATFSKEQDTLATLAGGLQRFEIASIITASDSSACQNRCAMILSIPPSDAIATESYNIMQIKTPPFPDHPDISHDIRHPF